MLNNRHLVTCAIALSLSAASLLSLGCNSATGGNAPTHPTEQTVADSTECQSPHLDIFALPDSAAEAWADSIMATLNDRERIAQLFVPRFDITKTTVQQIHRAIGIDKMGGLLFGKGSLAQHIELTNKAQSEADIPLMISLDGEWGLAMRIADTPKFPYNIALGAANDPQLAYEYGREVARQCREMAIQVNFAPDLDVNSNPDNPIIGYRSFGENPQIVGQLGSAYARGMIDGGVMPIGKHFPGHGDTSTDSHKTLPHIDHDINRLTAIEMLSFAMAIDDGLPSIMVGHLNIPAMDSSGTPASLSHKITTDWLRDSLGFDGLIFTDALAMKGAALTGENNCVSALLAGADILLGSTDPPADLNAVEAALKSGKLTAELINEKCRKVLIYKHKLGLATKPVIDPTEISMRLNTSRADSIITAIAQKSVTLLKNDSSILPLKADSTTSTLIVNIGAPAKNEFSNSIADFTNCTTIAIEGGKAVTQSQLSAIKKADNVVIALYSDKPWAQTAFNKIANTKDAIAVFFNNPFKIAKLTTIQKLKAIVVGYGDSSQIRKAAADIICGRISPTGKMPVNLPGVAAIGDGLTF